MTAATSQGTPGIVFGYFGLASTSLIDWFKDVAPLFQPITSETKTNRGSRMHIFQRSVLAMCD